MAKRIEYCPGEKVGPYGCIFIKEVDPKIKPNGKRVRKASFICPRCHKTFETLIELVRKGKTRSCGCYNREQITKHHKKDLTGQKFGLLTPIKIVKKDSKNHFIWLCHCDCGNKKVYALTHKLTNGSKVSCGCIHSKGELKVREILEKIDISFVQQKKFNDCINPETGCLLKFDFYLPDYNCCIEYDGEQHFFYRNDSVFWNNKKDFTDLKNRDKIKNKYCEDNNISLLRIPYTDFNQLDERYIKMKIGVLRKER